MRVSVRNCEYRSFASTLLLAAAVAAFSFNNLAWTEHYFLAGQASFYIATAALIFGLRSLGRPTVVFAAVLAGYVLFAAAVACVSGEVCTARPLSGLVSIGLLICVVELVATIIKNHADLERRFEKAFVAAAWLIVVLAVPDVLAIMSGDITSSWLENGPLRYSPQGIYDAPRLRGYTQEPSYLGMVIATLYPFVLMRLEKGFSLAAMALLLGIWICLVFSLSKTGLGACIIFTFIWILGRAGRRLLIVAVAAVLAVTALMTGHFDELIDANQAYIAQWENDGIDISTLTRTGHMFAAINAWLDHPLLGVGLGQSGFVLPDYYPEWLWQSPEAQHWARAALEGGTPTFSFMPKILAEIGLIGALLLAVAFIPTLRATKQLWWKDYYVRAFGSSALCFLIASFGVEGWQYLAGWMVVGVVVGLARRNAEVGRALGGRKPS